MIFRQKLYYLIRQRLHLSHNLIKSLDGMQQFKRLQFLSLTHNLIQDVQEFLKVPTSLTHLNVFANPLTTQPDYQFQLSQIFGNLLLLDNLHLSKEKRVQALNLKVIFETYGFTALTLLEIAKNDQCFNNKLDLLSDCLNSSTLTISEKLIQFTQKILMACSQSTCEHELINELNVSEEQVYSVAERVLQFIQEFQEQTFNQRTLIIHFATMSEATELNTREQTIHNFVNYSKQENEEIKFFPTFPYNDQYIIALLEFIHLQIKGQQPHTSQQVKEEFSSNKKEIKVIQQQLEQQEHLQQLQEQQEQDDQEVCNNIMANYINSLKTQYKLQKGIDILSNRLLKSQFTLLKQLMIEKTQKIQLKYQSAFYILMRLERNKKHRKYILLRDFKRLSKLIKIQQIIKNHNKQQVIRVFQTISNIMFNQQMMAKLVYEANMKLKVIIGLNPRYRIRCIGQKLKFELLQLKMDGLMRLWFRDLKVFCLQSKLTTIQRTKNPKGKRENLEPTKTSFYQCSAMEKFRNQRDHLLDY